MNVATKVISNIKSKAVLSKYVMVAEECCVKKIKGTAKRAEFIFENDENAEFFGFMVKSLAIFVDQE